MRLVPFCYFCLLQATDGTIAQLPLLGYEEHFESEVESLQAEYKDVITQHLDSKYETENVHCVLNDIVSRPSQG